MIEITETSTSEQVREYIVDAAKLDLVGPGRGLGDPDERLKGWDRPSTWYLTGFLIPTGTPPEHAGDQDEDEEFELVAESSGLPGESTEEKKSAKKAYFPSSMGLSFLVRKETSTLAVTISWGDYEFHKANEESGSEEGAEGDEKQ